MADIDIKISILANLIAYILIVVKLNPKQGML